MVLQLFLNLVLIPSHSLICFHMLTVENFEKTKGKEVRGMKKEKAPRIHPSAA